MPPHMHGGKGGRFGGGKPKNTKATVVRTLSYLREYRFRFAVVLVCLVIGSVTGVIGSLFIEHLIDNYIVPLTG